MPGMKIFCSVCNLTLNSHAQFAVHLTGKSHKRREKESTSTGGGSSATSSAQSPPVTKIVRANPIIRFVSGKSDSNAGLSQNNNQNVGESSEVNQADNCVKKETSESAPVKKNDGIFCGICVVQLTSQSQADMHYAGSKHKRAVAVAAGKSGETRGEGVKRKYEEMCDICNVPLHSKTVAEAHYAGSKHEKKLKLSQDKNAANPCPSNNGSNFQALQTTSYPGTSSGVTFPSQVTPYVPFAMSNPLGQDGQQQVIQPGSMFFCSFCNVSVNSQAQMDAHRSGGKHKSAVDKIVQQRKQALIPHQPQDQNRFVPHQPQDQNRFVPHQPQDQNRFVPHQPQDQNRFVPHQPQDQNRFVPHQPQDQNRFVSFSYNFQAGNFGNPNGSMPVRPAAPMAYPTPHY